MALKNPDEFDMKMANSKIVEGKILITESAKNPKERLVDQTKNIALINLKHSIEAHVKKNFSLLNNDRQQRK